MDKLELLCSLFRDSIVSSNADLAIEYAKELDVLDYDIWKLLYFISAMDIGRVHANIASYMAEEEINYRCHENENIKRLILLNMVAYLAKQPKTESCEHILKEYDNISVGDYSGISIGDGSFNWWKTMTMFYASLRDRLPMKALKSGLVLYKFLLKNNKLLEHKYLLDLLVHINVMDDEMDTLLLQYYTDIDNQLVYFINMVKHRTKDYTKIVNDDEFSYTLKMEDIRKIYGNS